MRLLKRLSKLLIFTMLLVSGFGLAAQDEGVRWTTSVKHLEGDLYEVAFHAKIRQGFHLYDLGPYDDEFIAVTNFNYETLNGVNIEGKPYHLIEPKRVFDEIFQLEIGFFYNDAAFGQKVRLTGNEGTLAGYVNWSICDEVSCLPPTDTDFKVTVKRAAGVSSASGNTASSGTTGMSTGQGNSANTGTTNAGGSTASGSTTAGSAGESAIAAGAVAGAVGSGLEGEGSSGEGSLIDNPAGQNSGVAGTSGAEEDVLSATDSSASSSMGGKSLWSLILESVLWGLMALITPCVFPMIPMTVSFFMKGSENKVRAKGRASSFGLFIVLLYTLPIAAIIFITWIFGGDSVTADIFNWLATHWLPNILFFLIFIIFAASFLGAFEITMPSKLVNRSDSKADRKGLGGVFFMALTLVLVSFSCTGPIVGSALIGATSGEFWAPIVAMLAFSITFAIPFTLFAFFPSLMNKMKSGSWLNSVKVVLGFIELALGLKFLMMADQSYQWGLLDRDIYLALWIVIFALLGLYLLGKLKFKHDSDLKHISVVRLTLAIISFAFVVWMLPGMFGAPLKGLGGYIPKLETQDFIVLNAKDNQVAALLQGGVAAPASTVPVSVSGVVAPGTGKYTSPDGANKPLHMAAGLQGFFTMEEGMAYSKAVGKPLFVDFTGHACANCIKMEENVIKNPEVFRILGEEFVMVALFGDDKRVLPESEWTVGPTGRARKQLGQINSDFVAAKYGASAQPTYIICDSEGNMLMPHVGYTPDVNEFIKYLRSGIDAYNARK